MKRLRERVFGGKAGIWLRRKKSATRSSSHSIRWDDERGRPIYGTAAISSGSDDELSFSPESSKQNVTTVQKTSPEEDGKTSFTPHRRRRAFGSRKTPRRPVDTDELFFSDSFATRQRSSAGSSLNAVQSSQSCTTPGDESLSSSQNSAPSDDSSQQSPLPKHNDDGGAFAVQTCDSIESLSQNSTRSNNAHQGTLFEKSNDDNDKNASTQEKSVFDFDDSSVSSFSSLRQPTATTGLTSARAYFEQLDAQSPLAQVPESVESKKPTIVRTTRRRRLFLQVNNDDYVEYRRACQEADVKPMSMDEYTLQRANFVTGKIYDGFLDE